MGNRIPDSMMEGRNSSCEIMVSLAWLFTHSPRAHPALRDTARKTASEPKYRGRFLGSEASKTKGAVSVITPHMISRWRNAERDIERIPRYRGTPLALYIFLTSLP